MTMPHSKPVRRNKLNKIRKRQGLAPLPVLVDELGEHIKERIASYGTTTLMVPLPTVIRAMLTKVRLAAQLKDPSIKASDQLFAGAILTGILPSLLEQSSAPLIAAPTKANLEQAHKVGKILAGGLRGQDA